MYAIFFQESDFYFMADPEEFATQCHPEKHLWQLLDSPLTRKEFLNLPNLRPKFFELGMMIVTPKTAFNKAVGAKVVNYVNCMQFYFTKLTL